jgi:hypothetical protein
MSNKAEIRKHLRELIADGILISKKVRSSDTGHLTTFYEMTPKGRAAYEAAEIIMGAPYDPLHTSPEVARQHYFVIKGLMKQNI